MQSTAASLDFDLSALSFWEGQGPAERDEAYALLRRRAPGELVGADREPRPATRDEHRRLLGGDALRRHPPRLAQPRRLLLGPRRDVLRRAAGDARGDAVVHRHGRAAPHDAARPGLRRVHAASGRPASRSGSPCTRAPSSTSCSTTATATSSSSSPSSCRCARSPTCSASAEADREEVQILADRMVVAGRRGDAPGAQRDAGRRRDDLGAHPDRGRAGGGPPRAPARRPDDGPRRGRGRRRAPDQRGDRGVLRPALGRGQRHHAPHDQPHDASAVRLPG